MVSGFGVSAECQSIGTIAKEQRAVARSRGLVIQPQNLLVGAYFELSFLGCGFLIHLSNRSESPRFRAPWKKIRQKYGTNMNRLYSRSIHCPASMDMHYVQWFVLKSVYEIMVCEKIRFSLHESGWTKPWCPGLVSWPSAKAQEPLNIMHLHTGRTMDGPTHS